MYIYIHNLYPLLTHYSLFSHIKFTSVSSLLIHSYKIISRMLYISISIQFPSIFHPFFFSASMFIQFHPLSSIIHPYFIHFFYPFPSIFNASSLVFINFCSCYVFLHLYFNNFPLPPSCICPHCPGTLIVLQDTSAVSKWSFYVSVRHSKTVAYSLYL